MTSQSSTITQAPLVRAGLTIHGTVPPAYDSILTEEALRFVASLHSRFEQQRRDLLAAREHRQQRLLAGELYDFDPQTRSIREGEWTVSPIPADLRDRRVEITGPVDRKMVINALNSGANVFMADFEDANSPTWDNNLQGQINLRDANLRTITYQNVAEGPTSKLYKLNQNVAVLKVRPRGWHLVERHVTDAQGNVISGSLFDFGLYVWHNTRALRERGSNPYFYLPKLEHHLEARLWDQVFSYAEEVLNVPAGSFKATVLIETLPASFQLHEILHELRTHIVGLNCGRWDYIFSYIKKLGHDPRFLLPDRAQVTMDKGFLRAYSQLVIQTCHKRGASAMGGMSAFIPVKNDPAANDAALSKVRADKEREVADGHDGTWVAHPALVPVAKAVFDQHMPKPNQWDNLRTDVQVSAADLLAAPKGTVTLAGLKNNIDVAIQYMAAWLGGQGAVPIYNLMEDAATAEISRAQVWQWLRHAVRLDTGEVVDVKLYERIRDEVVQEHHNLFADAKHRFAQATDLFDRLVRNETFTEFLTLPAYEKLAR